MKCIYFIQKYITAIIKFAEAFQFEFLPFPVGSGLRSISFLLTLYHLPNYSGISRAQIASVLQNDLFQMFAAKL